MNFINFTRPLIAGILHSFEPDHMSAVSVLASENAMQRKKVSFKTVFTASQWALGHSATLLLFGGIALLFKTALETFVSDISFWAGVSVGPIMVWLGIVAIRRNQKISNIQPHKHNIKKPIHLHGKKGEEITVNPINKSFWIGMLHGLAGTGGALTSALIISANTLSEAILILVIESIGIIISMAIYSYLLIHAMSRFMKHNISLVKWINGIIGGFSIFVGLLLMYQVFFE